MTPSKPHMMRGFRLSVLQQDEAGDATPGVNRIAVVDETTVLVAATRELKVRWPHDRLPLPAGS